jgi:hypothetical protein
MAPSYPSRDELYAWSQRLEYEVEQEKEAAKHLHQHYFDTDKRNRHMVEDLWGILADAENAHEAWRQQLWTALATYGDLTDHRGIVAALQLDIAPDLTPPSRDHVFHAAAAIRLWRARALGTPLVQYVLDFLDIMSADPRRNLAIGQRVAARDLLDLLYAPLRPSVTQGLFSGQDLSTVVWLLDLLQHYKQTHQTIKQILTRAHNSTTRLHALQDAFPDLSLQELRAIVHQATRKSEQTPRPAALAKALMAQRYGISPGDSISKALTSARHAQKIAAALAGLTRLVVHSLCIVHTPRHALHTVAYLLRPPTKKSGNAGTAVFH